MKKYLVLIPVFFLSACTGNFVADQSQADTVNEVSKEDKHAYRLIRDNLYSDDAGTLYMKSRTREHFETGKWIDFWIKEVYCDTCWTPTENGWTDITELKDFVDTSSFHLDSTDNVRWGDFYRDKNHVYFHKWMADGGTISIVE